MTTVNNTTTRSGVGAFGLLGLALVLLKAFSVIQVSWFWAIAPFWMPLALALLVFGAFLVFALVLAIAVGISK